MNELEPLYDSLEKEYRNWREFGKKQIEERLQSLREKFNSNASTSKRRVFRGSLDKQNFIGTATHTRRLAIIVLGAHLRDVRDDTAHIKLIFEDKSLNIFVNGRVDVDEYLHICGNVDHHRQYLMIIPDGFPGTDGFVNFETASSLLDIIDGNLVVTSKAGHRRKKV